MRNLLVIVLLHFVTTALCQTGKIHGQIFSIYDDNESLAFAQIFLINSKNETIKKTNSSIEGLYKFDSIQPGEYSIKVKFNIDSLYQNIRITDGIDLNKNLFFNPCPNSIKTDTCPLCNSKKFVIENRNGDYIYDIFFSKKKDERKYYRKSKRIGYCSDYNEKGEEFVYLIYASKDSNCKKWFCKKHKLEF